RLRKAGDEIAGAEDHFERIAETIYLVDYYKSWEAVTHVIRMLLDCREVRAANGHTGVNGHSNKQPPLSGQPIARAEEPIKFALPEVLPLTLADWKARELPEPDPVLGSILSTTTRGLLIGPTGLGKTNFLLAMGMAIADGADFLHWRGSGRRRKGLYIDG